MRWFAVVLLWVAFAIGGACADDDAPTADDHRHDACLSFLDALDAEKHDDGEREAEDHYADAAANAALAADADPKFREFADALEGAGYRSVRKDGDQVVLFTTCSPEQRADER